MSADSAKKPAPAAKRPNCFCDRGEKKDCDSEVLGVGEEVLAGSLIVPCCRKAICFCSGAGCTRN